MKKTIKRKVLKYELITTTIAIILSIISLFKHIQLNNFYETLLNEIVIYSLITYATYYITLTIRKRK